MTKILIDADGCPVVDLTIQVAKSFGIPVTLVCDTSHRMEREGADTVTVDKGSDASDFAIVNRVVKNSIVVTQDYGLAAMVLAKKGYAINQNGWLYTEENMDQLLHFRHVSNKVRQAGGRLKGPKKRTKENDLKFKTSLVRLCEKLKTEDDNNIM